MTNEKSLQVAQGLSILSLLIASGRIDAIQFMKAFVDGGLLGHLEIAAADGYLSDEDRARLLDAIEMVSP